MANIDIKNISDLALDSSDLALDGNDLFEDSESFMTELIDDSEKEAIMGGCFISCLVSLNRPKEAE